MVPRETIATQGINCLPAVVTDLRLHQRKAFELCAAVLSALRTCGANPDEPAVNEASRKARQLADIELRTQNNDVPFEAFFADALEKVISQAQEVADSFYLSEETRRAVETLRGLQASPPDLLTAEARCLLKSTYVACVEAAKDFYSGHVTRPFEFPDISLQIGVADRVNTAFPGRVIAFNGSVRYDDGEIPAPKHSVVNLKVSPAKLDRGCLSALAYILMHEILCHWPQMAPTHGPRPNPALLNDPYNKDGKQLEVDPISEGWLDNLAAEVLSRTLRRSRQRMLG